MCLIFVLIIVFDQNFKKFSNFVDKYIIFKINKQNSYQTKNQQCEQKTEEVTQMETKPAPVDDFGSDEKNQAGETLNQATEKLQVSFSIFQKSFCLTFFIISCCLHHRKT